MWAPTLEELFAEAAVGLVALMGTATGDRIVETATVEAGDAEALFVDWLSEVLFLFEAREVVPTDVRVRIDRERWTLEAEIEGVRVTTFEQSGPAVKAVTYHALELSETSARVYLDV